MNPNIEIVRPLHRSSWFTPDQCRSYYGVPYQFREIQIHWWNDPSTKPTHDGTVNYIKNKVGGSVNYVVSSGRVTKMVDEENCAITTQNGNPYGIKIECSPYGTDADYKTFAWLIADIRKRRGNLPLTPHKKYWNTACPGSLDLERMDREANALINGGGTMPPDYAPVNDGDVTNWLRWAKQNPTYQPTGEEFRHYKAKGWKVLTEDVRGVLPFDVTPDVPQPQVLSPGTYQVQ